MMKTIHDAQAYAALFKGTPGADSGRQKEALNHALDIRKFEIDTYWKRATYFWALIAASLVAYFAIEGKAEHRATLIVTCLGALFSLGWYLVNRGSSSWQRNWEVHVDLLEDEIIGPLHKTLINRHRQSFWDLAGPYPYSPSRINTILSLILVLTWIILLCDTAQGMLASEKERAEAVYFLVATAVAALSLFWAGRPARSGNGSHIEFEARTRVYHSTGTESQRPAEPVV